MTGDDVAIAVRDLQVSFGGRPALRGVDLDVPLHRITVVVGPSGSGKTTLLRTGNRLNECYPGCTTSGSVRVRLAGELRDVHASPLPLEQLRRRASMVFQAPVVLPGSVRRNFAVPLRAALDLDHAAIAARAETWLRRTGLWDEVHDRLDAPAAHLSGGQQQRLCLARALALDPDVLLVDEPTAHLDSANAALVEELLLELRRQITIVAVSHSAEQATRLGDRIVTLADGRVVDVRDRAGA